MAWPGDQAPAITICRGSPELRQLCRPGAQPDSAGRPWQEGGPELLQLVHPGWK